MDEICQSGTEYLQSQALTTDAFQERKRHSLVFGFPLLFSSHLQPPFLPTVGVGVHWRQVVL